MGWQDDPIIDDEEQQETGWRSDPIVEDTPSRPLSVPEQFAARMKFREEHPEAKEPESIPEISQELKRKYPADYRAEIQQENMLAHARKRVKEAWFPGTRTGALHFATLMANPYLRAYDPEKADIIQGLGGAFEQAMEEEDKKGVVPPIIKRGLRSAIPQVASTALYAAAGGFPAVVGMAAMQESDAAFTRGRDAGLSGKSLAAYAVSQAGIEAGFESVSFGSGLGKIFKMAGGKEAVHAGMGSALKSLGISSLKEVGSENLTEITHSIEDKLSGVDPNALTLDSISRTVADTTVQTAIQLALPGAASIRQAKKAANIERNRNEIIEAAAKDEAPSRKQWKRWGLNPEMGRTEDARLIGVKAIGQALVSEQIKAPEQVVEPSEIIRQEQTERYEPEGVELGGIEQVIPGAALEAAPEIAPEAALQVSTDVETTVQSEIPLIQEATEALEVEAPPAPDVTGIANSIVTELRAKRGEGVLESTEAESFEQWVRDADVAIKDGTISPDALFAEAKENPRPLSDEEVAAVSIRYRQLNDSFTIASDQLDKAIQSGDIVAISRADGYSKFALKQLSDAEESLRIMGTESGRALVARKILLKADMSLGSLIRRSRAAKGGEQLTAVEHAEVKELARKVAELEAKLESRDSEQELRRIEAAIDTEVARSRPKKGFRKPSARKVQARSEVEAAWGDFSARFFGEKRGVSEFISEEKGALDPEVLASAVRLVKAYINLGSTTFSEFYATAKSQLGQKLDDAREVLKQAWSTVRAEGSVRDAELDPEDARAISRFAKKQTRAIVEAGTTDRETVVDLVHEELQQILPEITRRQTMDAISGYGLYSELSKDEVSAQVRDITGQLQQLAKLEDIQAGKAPKKTGQERRMPSDEERRLIQQVNEAKRRGGFAVIDPEKQLKTALDAAKTAVRNRISDMTAEIQAREKIVKQRTQLKPDEELLALRKQRDELRVEYEKIFPKQPLSIAQKAAIAERAVDRAIAQLEADIKSGAVVPKKRGLKISSPSLDEKRAKLESLRQQRDAMREALNPKKSPEERQLAAYKTSLLSRLAELDRRMKEGDFSKKKRKELPLDKEATELKFRLNEEKIKFKQMERKWAMSQATAARKLWNYTANTLNASRAIMTSFDFSAVFRQGAPSVFGHPVVAVKAAAKMLKAFASKKSEFEIMEGIRDRDNWANYQRDKLAITATEGMLSQQEEAFMGEWVSELPNFVKKIPIIRKIAAGIPASNRAYTTFLNLMRADMYDSMTASIAKSGEVTAMEGKVIASFINAMTGRANLGKAQAASEFLATVFFSPKYVVSRFQLVLGRHLWGGNARTRKAIAKEYARTLIGMGTFVGSVILLSKLFYPDDEQPTIELNPFSSNFMMLMWGDKRLDFTGGLSQVVVLLSRTMPFIGGKTKRATGEIVPIVGEDIPFGGRDLYDVISDFERGKFSPWLGTTVDLLVKKNIVDEPVTLSTAIPEMVVPLSFRDIYDAMREDRISRGTALSLLVMLGMSVRKYQNATPGDFAKKIVEHKKLIGFDKKKRKPFDYSERELQVVAEAKRQGISLEDMISELIMEGKEEGKKRETISDEVKRLRRRFSITK